MLATVYFNDDSFFVTHEVSYVSTDRYLTSELQTYELSVTDMPPQSSFGRGGTTSQIFCESCQLNLWHCTYSLTSHLTPSPPALSRGGERENFSQHRTTPNPVLSQGEEI